ncbi:hypothetical protein [Variovorax sp. RO1]|uniref:hypothetical protein n=1 Tax=Variovorax sp. RO1 TaxID=2066034 RepID=UPI00117FBF53|nr:hypothetical protein [Variovorax sp. RO1]
MDDHLPGVVAGSPVLAHFFTCVIFPPALSIQRSASEVLHESGQLYFNEEASTRPPKVSASVCISPENLFSASQRKAFVLMPIFG